MSAESPVAASLKLGRYVLERRIASGGMADVYLARHIGAFGFAKNVALKVLRSEVSGDEDHVRMFLREAMVAAEFKHPNLVQVYEVGEEGRRLYLAMELVRGLSLATIMQNLATRKRSIPIALATRIARDALEGLAHAHEAVNAEGQPLQLVHRDVSPQNVLIDVSGVVKVVDFGIARAETRAGRTQGAQIKGKFGYMAPEQWSAGADIDARADLFSLAVMLYETSTGSRRLFRGQSAPELYRAIVNDTVPPPTMRIADYPENLSAVVMRGLARDMHDRWPSARAMRDALDEVMLANGWSVGPDDLARLVALSLDGQSIEDRWEHLGADAQSTAGDDVTAAAVAALGAARTPTGRLHAGMSGGFPAITPGDGMPASPSDTSMATVSARPSALGLNTAPAQPQAPAPAPPTPAPATAPAPVVDEAPRSPSVWMFAALAGWLVALSLGVAWWRTRARLAAVEGSAPVAVAPQSAPERVVPAPLVLLSDPTLAEAVATPWAEVLQGEARGLRVSVERGDALGRMLRGDASLALRVGLAASDHGAAARALGFDLRSPASEHVVAYDHAVVVVHPSNPLPSVDVAELAALFAGRARSYEPLRGAAVRPRAVVCGAGAPTRAFLDAVVIPAGEARHAHPLAADAAVVVDEAAAAARVASDPSAVALVRLAWVTRAVRVVPVRPAGAREPVAATRDTIRGGAYPLVRPVVLYTRAAPVGEADGLLRIALSAAGQTLIERAGYVSR